MQKKRESGKIMENLEAKIEELKEKTNRPNAWDADAKRLIIACGGDVDKAAALILDQLPPYQIFKEEPQ